VIFTMRHLRLYAPPLVLGLLAYILASPEGLRWRLRDRRLLDGSILLRMGKEKRKSMRARRHCLEKQVSNQGYVGYASHSLLVWSIQTLSNA
jgi:hypothetical protein